MNAPVSARELFWRATALSFRETGAPKELATHSKVYEKGMLMKARRNAWN